MRFGFGARLSRSVSLFSCFVPIFYLKDYLILKSRLLPVIDSTNQYLLDHTQALSSGALCLAEHQSQGRGRRGRSWQSPFGTSIAMSIYWQLKGGVSAAMGLSLVVGLATVNALETLGVPDLQLKWPNDIYCQGKKLGGILVEMRGQVGEAAHVIIGVGLNLNLPSEQVIEQSWINLSEVCEGLPDKNILVSALYQAIICQIHIYEAEGFSKFQAQWQRWDIFYDQRVVLFFDDRQVTGIAKGVNEQGGFVRCGWRTHVLLRR